MSSPRLCVLLGLVAFLGCGGAQRGAKNASAPAAEAKAAAGAAPQVKAEAQAVPRKIIYTASVSIVVETFDEGEEKLDELIKSYPGAYIASSEVRGAPGERRYGTWTVRIPVAPFDDFLDAVAKLGELQQRKLDSEDITDRFFDLKAELQTNQTEEESLRKLLETSSGKLEDVIKVRQALTDIRARINQQQGQINRWDKLTELATAHITIHERRDYVPPQSPDFGTSISRTFKGSWDALVDFGKGLVLFVVALIPWLPVMALAIVPLWMLIRRWRTPLPEMTHVEPPT